MISDDTFRSKLRGTIAGLRERIAELADCLDAEETEAPNFWRLSVRPHASQACPLEIVLRQDQQYDLQIGGEVYEDRPIESLDMFEPLLRAVAAGRVVTRTWSAPGTGAMHSVETLVAFEGGALSGERRNLPVSGLVPRDTCLASDRHWLPYRR